MQQREGDKPRSRCGSLIAGIGWLILSGSATAAGNTSGQALAAGFDQGLLMLMLCGAAGVVLLRRRRDRREREAGTTVLPPAMNARPRPLKAPPRATVKQAA